MRICRVDRELFEYCDWLRFDEGWDDFKPDELDEGLCEDDAFPPTFGGPFPRRSIPRLEELPDAKPVGRALAWQDGGRWVYTTHRMEAPLNAAPANRSRLGGKAVLQVALSGERRIVHGARKALPSPPPPGG